MNTILYERQLEEYYCTLLYTVFDFKRRIVTLANAGLPYPVRKRGGALAVVVELLLLGGDAGPGRYSLRTDSMIVVSMDPVTGDTAMMDADGYLWYQGRSDDVFKAAGYRIGPSEIENCLVKHPAVANAAVVPKPDSARGAVVKAYVVLAPDPAQQRASLGVDTAAFDAALQAELQAHVRGRLAPYEYPKEIEFVAELPMTTTGKVQRRILRLQEEARAAQHA